jgi:hypothetical protein
LRITLFNRFSSVFLRIETESSFIRSSNAIFVIVWSSVSLEQRIHPGRPPYIVPRTDRILNFFWVLRLGYYLQQCVFFSTISCPFFTQFRLGHWHQKSFFLIFSKWFLENLKCLGGAPLIFQKKIMIQIKVFKSNFNSPFVKDSIY